MSETASLATLLHDLLPDWSPSPDRPVRTSTVRCLPDEDNADPRISVKEYIGEGGNLTMAWMVGTQGNAGLWQEMKFTPEQGLQIVASILTRPSMEKASQTLLDRLRG